LSSNSDDFIDSAQLLPYPSASNIPISISLTEFHFVLLFKDRVVAICNLNDALTYEELLPLVSLQLKFFFWLLLNWRYLKKPSEEIQGMTVDPVRKTYWVYTDSSLFELVVGNEARDVWEIYLEKGDYDVALKYAKVHDISDIRYIIC